MMKQDIIDELKELKKVLNMNKDDYKKAVEEKYPGVKITDASYYQHINSWVNATISYILESED